MLHWIGNRQTYQYSVVLVSAFRNDQFQDYIPILTSTCFTLSYISMCWQEQLISKVDSSICDRHLPCRNMTIADTNADTTEQGRESRDGRLRVLSKGSLLCISISNPFMPIRTTFPFVSSPKKGDDFSAPACALNCFSPESSNPSILFPLPRRARVPTFTFDLPRPICGDDATNVHVLRSSASPCFRSMPAYLKANALTTEFLPYPGATVSCRRIVIPIHGYLICLKRVVSYFLGPLQACPPFTCLDGIIPPRKRCAQSIGHRVELNRMPQQLNI